MLALILAAAISAAVAPARPAAPPPVVLGHDGIVVGGVKLMFGKATRAQAVALATQALGKPVEAGNHGDCGQGSEIAYAKFARDFELSFVGGRLSGWTEDGAALATDRGIRVGATVAALRRAYPDLGTDPGDEANGGLGPSFQSERGPAGWLDGVRPTSRITGMFAGATCLAGI